MMVKVLVYGYATGTLCGIRPTTRPGLLLPASATAITMLSL
jgi:hypothetical protein